ncbi:MAG: hypothetical protein ACXIVQ_03210 [Acidimicrobiales bacterium]
MALVVALVMGVAACGDDDGDASASGDAPSGASTDASGGGGSDDGDGELPDGMPPLLGGDERISTGLDTLAYALGVAMSDSVVDYDVDGNTLRLQVVEPSTEFSMHCMIIGMSAGSLDLPEDSTIIVVFSDGEETDCDI